jgi:hypothetical protein
MRHFIRRAHIVNSAPIHACIDTCIANAADFIAMTNLIVSFSDCADGARTIERGKNATGYQGTGAGFSLVPGLRSLVPG